METIGGDQDSSGCTPTREPTDGLTKGDQLFDKKIGKTETTDGQNGGDKPFNKKTGTRKTTDGQTGSDKPFNKRLEQEKLLMVKLEVINPSIKDWNKRNY